MADANKHSTTTLTGIAAQQSYAVGFPVLRGLSDLVVTVDAAPATLSSYNGTDVTINTPTITGGETILIKRASAQTFATLPFQASNVAVYDSDDFDTLVKSLLYALQDSLDRITELEP